MIGERFGHIFDRPLAALARFIPLSPNALSASGFVITVAASYVLLTDLFWGGLLVLAGGVFDVMDGVVARVNGKTSRFGAFFDSVLDRYSDAVIFLAIAWNLASGGHHEGMFLSIATLVGAFLISYARARAEGLGEQCKKGLLERPERIVLISFGAITGAILPVLWIMTVLTHFTVLQRIYHVWRVTQAR